jgi:hypothetical protein
MTDEQPIQESELIKNSTIGQDFIEWAECYWDLKNKYDIPSKSGEEHASFDFTKKTFIWKIDDLIKNRLGI